MSSKTFGFRQSNPVSKWGEIIFSGFVFLIVILIIGGGVNLGGEVVTRGEISVKTLSISEVSASGNINSSEIDFKKLLGFSRPATYLVVLMNKGEVRPLGGFWGSFAKVEIASGQIKNVQIHDSYWLPSLKKEYFCDSTLKNVGLSKCVSFVDSARVGFTDYDGKVVKTLYEKTFSGEKVQGVIFLRSDLFEYLIPDYINYHLMREFRNASSKVLENKPNKDRYRKFINAFIHSYQKKIAKRAIELLVKDPTLFEGKVYLYLPDLKQDLDLLQRPYLSGGFYWFDTDRSFSKGWLFVNKQVYVWEDEVLKYIGEGGYLGSYTGENIHIRVVYSYDFDFQQQAKGVFNNLQVALGVSLPDEIKYILGYYSYIKSLSQIYYPDKYVLSGSTIKDLNISKWRASRVAYFLRDKKFTKNTEEVIIDFWLKQKKFLK